MGTSTSSSGPKSNIPFDPPWLDDENPEGSPENENPDDDTQAPPPNDIPPSEIAPPRRFADARCSLGKYANIGDRNYFSRAAGHYSKKGMGGARRVGSRMRQSTRSAANLFSFLTSASTRSDTETTKWLENVKSKKLSHSQVINLIVNHVAPQTGGLDDESCRDSMAHAMSEFMEKHRDADLLELNQGQIQEITERFIANEAYNRLILDIGQVFERSAVEGLRRRNMMREYLYSDISAAMEDLWKTNANPTKSAFDKLLQKAIQNTFEVYEDAL